MKNDFKHLKTVTINGKRVTVRESQTTRFFKIGSCKIPAKSVDEAVRKFTECQAKWEAGNV